MFQKRVPLVMVLGVTLSLILSLNASSSAKRVLTDGEMSSVYGGWGEYCGLNGWGCSPGSSTGSCDPLIACDGVIISSCRQLQNKCKDGYGTCTDASVPCLGAYRVDTCVFFMEFCIWDAFFYECEGYKTGCW